ncbi:thiamine pyrophosphate-binding protein [Sinorhizobium meliloti]|uniref:thiamine pyrophosphate-binding protein n=1 Tax=Rhizobium meliloti TaxID=382 RepID=UPI0018E230F4|nr:thiamine pyrophosphate-binding protein [Sinorhizobium meliloti]
MEQRPRMLSGARLIVEALLLHGADILFGVPGESYLGVLDAILDAQDRLRYITCRQEGGAAYMAEAYGKLTGRPGICFVTRGPGACNAAIGLHTAFQDSTPMILFIGQVGTDVVEREAFQEIDYRRMFGPVAKWVAQIDRPDRIAEFISRAFHTAVNGRPGPVVLVLPEDSQSASAAVVSSRSYARVATYPGSGDMLRLKELLTAARRPLAIVGGGGWTPEARLNLQTFVETFDLPVISSFRRQDILDNDDLRYAGDLSPGMNPAVAERVRSADLILAIGTRLGEMTSAGYTLLDIPSPRQALVHIHPGAEELGRVYQPVLAIQSGMPEFAEALAGLSGNQRGWSAWRAQARKDYEAWQEAVEQPGSLNLGEILLHIRQRLPADTIVTNGAGNYATWVHRFHRYRSAHTQLAPTSGAMGYGVPAAIAAKLIFPGRAVVAFAGDGCFMMNGQELATAARYGLKILFVVVNNGMYGTIRMHQEREYPTRISGTTLLNPDFITLASAYGFHAEAVERTEDFAAALERALAAPTSALLDLKLDPDAISPRTTITALRSNRR